MGLFSMFCISATHRQSVAARVADAQAMAPRLVMRHAMPMHHRMKMRNSSQLLLRQRRMLPAEVGRGRVLADLDDAAANGAGAAEVLEQRLAVVAADGAGEL